MSTAKEIEATSEQRRRWLVDIGLAIGMPEGFDFKDILGRVLRVKHTLDVLTGRIGKPE